MHGSPLRGLSLNLSILSFLNSFFHEIWSRPSERAVFSEWNIILFDQKMSPYSWVIGCQKWLFCIFYGIFIENSHFQPHVAHKERVVFLSKKMVFYFKFHKKNYWECSKLTNSKINPSMENHAHFISCKPPHTNHPR